MSPQELMREAVYARVSALYVTQVTERHRCTCFGRRYKAFSVARPIKGELRIPLLPWLRASYCTRWTLLPIIASQLLQAIPVEQVYPFASHRNKSLRSKAFEQSADNFPDAAQFIGQHLMRGLNRLTLAE